MRPRPNQAGMIPPALEDLDHPRVPQSHHTEMQATASALGSLTYLTPMHSLPSVAATLPPSNLTSVQSITDLTPDSSGTSDLREYHEPAMTDDECASSPDLDLTASDGLVTPEYHLEHVNIQLANPHLELLIGATDPNAPPGSLFHNQNPYPTHLAVSAPHAPVEPIILSAEDQSFLLSAPPSTQPLTSDLIPSEGLTSDPHAHFNSFSATHFTSLGPENHGLNEFLRIWALSDRWGSSSMPGPWLDRIDTQMAARPWRMSYEQLNGDGMDFQGLNWEDMGVSREHAHERRKLTYKNYTNKIDSDKWKERPFEGAIPNTENFFKFRRMDIRRNVHLAHFQLRNVLACADRSHVFYPDRESIHRINPLSGHSDVAMDLSDLQNVQISTLDAKHGMLVVGTFNGEYCMRSVHSQDMGFTEGQVTSHSSCITNHLQIHESRHYGGPVVAFASNDQSFRVMDIASEKFVLDKKFKFPMNCTALSPDRRLRVMVGDSNSVMIACADTGDALQWLSGHRDHGFACAWSDDGWTVATAAQDKSVKIWDARRWTNSSAKATPVATLRSELASVRGLRFSPIGSGPPVLVAAEEADYINIINARTFRHKQTINIFGEIGGVGFTDDGNELNVLCTDRHRGGLIQLDRCNYGSKSDLACSTKTSAMDDLWRQSYKPALHDEESLYGGLSRGGLTGPRTRVYWDEMEPF